MEFNRRRAAQILRGAARRLDPPPAEPAVKRPAAKAPAKSAVKAAVTGPTHAELAMRLSQPAEVGSRVVTGFFDNYPRFFETSRTANVPGRLNARYDAIFGENKDIFDGARVLDIASHDGRWSLAALATGARFVTGVEGRAPLVAHAEQSLAHYGFGPDRFAFHAGDVFDFFRNEKVEANVVMCLGFIYHTLRYHELWEGMIAPSPEYIVIDTESRAMLGGPPIVYLQSEGSGRQQNAIADEFNRDSTALTGRPNLNAISMMAQFYGYTVERLSNWTAIARDNPDLVGIGNYRNYKRITIRLRRK